LSFRHQDEKTFALLAHVLGFSGFIAPLVFFLVKRDSKFVSFHALHRWRGTHVLGSCFWGHDLCSSFRLIASGGFHSGGHAEPPFAFFGFLEFFGSLRWAAEF